MKTAYISIPVKVPYRPKRVDRSKKVVRYVSLPIGTGYQPKRLKKSIFSRLPKFPTIMGLRFLTILMGFALMVSLMIPMQNEEVVDTNDDIQVASVNLLSFTTDVIDFPIMKEVYGNIPTLDESIDIDAVEVFYEANPEEDIVEPEEVVEEPIQEEIEEVPIEEPSTEPSIEEEVIQIESDPSIAAIEQLDLNATIEYLGNYRITGYDPYCSHCCGKSDGITASGAEAIFDYTVAMNDVEFGTKIYIPGYGVYEVQDRGGSSVGVDIARDGHDACYQVTKRDVPVYIVLE